MKHSNNSAPNDDDEDDPSLLRGTTVSQSFIKNIQRRSAGDGSGASSTSNGFRRADRLYNSSSSSATRHRRHRSATELLAPTDELEKRYAEYNQSEVFDVSDERRQSFRPRTLDRAVL